MVDSAFVKLGKLLVAALGLQLQHEQLAQQEDNSGQSGAPGPAGEESNVHGLGQVMIGERRKQ
jgi:hypothetical protein